MASLVLSSGSGARDCICACLGTSRHHEDLGVTGNLGLEQECLKVLVLLHLLSTELSPLSFGTPARSKETSFGK